MCYKQGAIITVDEQLLATQARCTFTLYMPNKPNKLGINFWLASDGKSKYVLSKELVIDYKELNGRSTVQTEGISSSKSPQNQTHISMKLKRCQIAQCTNNKRNNICGTYHKRVCDAFPRIKGTDKRNVHTQAVWRGRLKREDVFLEIE
uniref:DDE_Tnp_1_7 domain-containing protein n=1 Tax=Glossina austeni TaxID=7395 RepID=A0A1A9VMA5_GLOAU